MAASLANPRLSLPSAVRLASQSAVAPRFPDPLAVHPRRHFSLPALFYTASLKARLPFPYVNLRLDRSCLPFASASLQSEPVAADAKVFHGQCFVVGDNIDTDQIIPAEYLTLVPSKRDEYEKLGSYALCGLPVKYGRFVEEGQDKSKYSIIIAGSNFGCGSSREHAPVALGASGVKAVVAGSYARIFFRNSVATGELYPLEAEAGLSNECQTGDYITVDMERGIVINHTRSKEYALNPIGDAGPVIEAGGIFAYARKTGMIATRTS